MAHLLQLHKLGSDDQRASFSQRNCTPVSTPTLPKMPPHQEWKMLHPAHLAGSVVHICFLFVASTSPWLEASCGRPAVPSYGQRQGGAGWSLKTEPEVSCLPWLRDRVLFPCSLLIFTSPEGCETGSSLFYNSSVLMLPHWVLFHEGKGTVSPVPVTERVSLSLLPAVSVPFFDGYQCQVLSLGVNQALLSFRDLLETMRFRSGL